MRLLVLCDDLWHPAEVIRKGFALLESAEMRFDYVECAKDILTAQMLSEYQVIVNCKMNNISAANTHPWFDKGVTEAGPAEFRSYVENGGGFLSVHAGNAFYQDDDSGYVDFVGNYFVQHSPRCDVSVQITAQHPVTHGVQDFTVRDEHYEVVLTTDDALTLCTTRSATGGSQIGGYVRTIGRGRLCALMPGHIYQVFQHPQYQKMLKNAIIWCAGAS